MLEVTHISQKVKRTVTDIESAREYHYIHSDGRKGYLLLPRLGHEYLTSFQDAKVVLVTEHAHTVETAAFLILALLETFIGLDYFATFGDDALSAAQKIIRFIEETEGKNVANRVKELEERFEAEQEAKAVCMTEHPLPEPRSAAEPF